MGQIQLVITGYTLDQRVNADETGVFFGAAPKNQFVPASAARAMAPESNEKARFTSLLWGKATGEMGPSFNIIKMDVKGTDLSTSRVLKNLHKLAGFTVADGWELRTWERTLTLPMRGKSAHAKAKHVRPYLLHVASLTVITIQIKAWMDSAGICMWVDVQLGPYYQTRGGKCCVVWDNCGSHNVPAVAECFRAWGIHTENLPPKMTDILQVMDLVVNGPVKAGIRRKRIEALFNFFQTWKITRLQHDAVKDQQLAPPAFLPPKPTQQEGLRIVLDVLKTALATESFKASMAKCFVAVGLAEQADGTFVEYSVARKGFLKSVMPQVQMSEEAVSVGELASEVQLVGRDAEGWGGWDGWEECTSDEEGGEEEGGGGGGDKPTCEGNPAEVQLLDFNFIHLILYNVCYSLF